LPLAIINDLEDKLGRLIAKLNALKQENEELKENCSLKEQENKALKEQSEELHAAADSALAEAAEQKQKLDDAAQRITGLISRLEAVD
jgi:regulator of replication initiation timing